MRNSTWTTSGGFQPQLSKIILGYNPVFVCELRATQTLKNLTQLLNKTSVTSDTVLWRFCESKITIHNTSTVTDNPIQVQCDMGMSLCSATFAFYQPDKAVALHTPELLLVTKNLRRNIPVFLVLTRDLSKFGIVVVTPGHFRTTMLETITHTPPLDVNIDHCNAYMIFDPNTQNITDVGGVVINSADLVQLVKEYATCCKEVTVEGDTTFVQFSADNNRSLHRTDKRQHFLFISFCSFSADDNRTISAVCADCAKIRTDTATVSVASTVVHLAGT